MARVDIVTTTVSNAMFAVGTQRLVETPSGVLYIFYILNSSNDLAYKKSTDNGFTWSKGITINTGSIQQLCLFSDWEAGIAGTKIRIWWTDDSSANVIYSHLDTATDTLLASPVTVFDGASTNLTGADITGCIARGGYLYCRVCIDAGAEGGFFKSTDDGATWTGQPLVAINETLATLDQCILLPGWNADNNDVQIIFWDQSAGELSVQRFDQSAVAGVGSWAETSISTGIVLGAAALASPHYVGVVDLANSRNVVIAWNAVDGANADLLGWVIDDTNITAFTTPVVSNGTDDQGLCGLTIDASGNWIAYYAGKSDGSETWNSSIKIYQKVSSDSGATWGAETLLSTFTLTAPYTQALSNMYAIPKAYTKTGAANPILYTDFTNIPYGYMINLELPSGSAGGMLIHPGMGGRLV